KSIQVLPIFPDHLRARVFGKNFSARNFLGPACHQRRLAGSPGRFGRERAFRQEPISEKRNNPGALFHKPETFVARLFTTQSVVRRWPAFWAEGDPFAKRGRGRVSHREIYDLRFTSRSACSGLGSGIDS